MDQRRRLALEMKVPLCLQPQPQEQAHPTSHVAQEGLAETLTLRRAAFQSRRYYRPFSRIYQGQNVFPSVFD